MAKEREKFASSITAVMAMAGSAIGLGNIWRFPYMVGQNGGAAFIVQYAICVAVLALPILLCESIIGRGTQSNTFGAMEQLAPGTKWKWLGLLTVISPLIILSFYSVVGGWSIAFFCESASTGFRDNATTAFQYFSTSVTGPLVCHTIFLLATALIVLCGVKSGIEMFNKISLPLLFVLIVVIAVYSIRLPGSSDGIRYLVKADWSYVTPKTAAYALGQAFFSLSLGVGTILTYSSYMRKDSNLLSSGLGTICFDMIFAILAGFAVMPAVFATGIEPGAGPGLIFESLPYIFVKMGDTFPLLSRIISIVFFFTIIIAALTSSISMFEVGVAYLVEEKGKTRKAAVARLFCWTWLLGAACSLSFGPLSGFKLLGMNIFSFCDALTSNFMMTFGALLFVLFVGWKMKKAAVRDELTNNGSLKFNNKAFGIVYFLIRYVAPFAVIAIFVTNIISL